MGRPKEDREAVYKANLLSPGWLQMLLDHELDDYPLKSSNYPLWSDGLEYILENTTLIGEARQVFWSMNAFQVGGFWLGELLARDGAQESIAQVQVNIDPNTEPEYWEYEYKSLKKLVRECPNMEWIIIRVGLDGGRPDSSMDEQVIEQRATDILQILQRGRQKGKNVPKRGIYLFKWIAYNSCQECFGGEWADSGLPIEEYRWDRADCKIRRQQIEEGAF